MKNSIKRLSLAFLALGLTTPVLADTCSPFDVTVPNQQGGLTFGADALYMRGTSSNLGYGASFGPFITPITGGTTVAGSIADVDTSYQWGFDAILGYRLPGTGNDITATWTHLGQFDDSDTNNTPLSTEAPASLTQYGNVEFDYDAVDLDLGQRVNFGDYFNFRMFAGARWADIKEDTSSNYTTNIDDETPVSLYLAQDADNEFRGIGPQIGFDGRYCLGYGFGIDAGVTASLLVGDIDSTGNIATTTTVTIDDEPQVVDAFNLHLTNDDRDRVVPALDGNIGLDYTFAFANCDRSYLTVQAGYKVITYFDATQTNVVHFAPDPDNSGNGSDNTLGNSSHDINFDGPYAGIKVNL